MIYSQLRVLIATKEMKENRKISYREIQAKTGIPYSTLSRLANGKIRRFTDEMLIQLCGYFSCDIGDLLRYQPNEQENAEDA